MFALRPEPALVRARASGERVVATVRFAVAVLFGIVGTASAPHAFIFGLSLAAVVYAGAILWLSWKVPHPSLSWITTTLDTTVITLALSVFVIYGEPLKTLTNKLYFEAYFFVLANSVLRYDWRLVAFTLLVVLAEFLGLSAFISVHWDVSRLEPAPDSFSGIFFALRVLLLAATGMSSVIVATWALHLRLLIGTDQLTGLPQRRPFLERIEEELGRADGTRASLSLALIDVDDFKKFNDRYGHVAGDGALRALAGVLQKSVRTTDLVARFGGEEFVVAFPRATVDQALRRTEDLRIRLAATALPGTPEPVSLTVSIGVASWPADGSTFDAIFATADQRLYEAKENGKNQVVGPPSHGRLIHLRDS
jgi:diguanylate cyclase (GGDEF)-like protein